MPSRVDQLADKLSEKTGTTFEVRRGRNARNQMRYGLKATRDDVSYCFQMHHPMTLDELLRWLASINDMVSMGFIRVGPEMQWADDPVGPPPIPPPSFTDEEKADQKYNAQMLEGCETEDEFNAELRAQTQGDA